jgi:regulatory protein
MGQITQIRLINKGKTEKAEVFLDDNSLGIFAVETIITENLKVGKIIDEKVLTDLLLRKETKIAFDKAVDYLSKSMKTQKEIYDYLIAKKFSEDISKIVVDKLVSYKFLDDEEYCKVYVDYNLKNKGAKKIKFELLKKGVNENIINNELENIDTNRQIEGAKALASRYMKNKEWDLKNKNKLYNHLLSKGYDYEIIQSAIKDLKNGDDF